MHKNRNKERERLAAVAALLPVSYTHLESARTVFCNKKTVGYSEYFKSQQTGKLVEAKYEVHKADYGGDVYKRQLRACARVV